MVSCTGGTGIPTRILGLGAPRWVTASPFNRTPQQRWRVTKKWLPSLCRKPRRFVRSSSHTTYGMRDTHKLTVRNQPPQTYLSLMHRFWGARCFAMELRGMVPTSWAADLIAVRQPDQALIALSTFNPITFAPIFVFFFFFQVAMVLDPLLYTSYPTTLSRVLPAAVVAAVFYPMSACRIFTNCNTRLVEGALHGKG